MPHVLVVEDDPDIALVLRLTLAARHTVEVVGDLAAARARWAAAPRPDAVVLDLGLPDGSGADFCREVKEAAPTLPVVIVSAHRDLLIDAARCGADRVIAKPFDPDEVQAVIDGALKVTRVRRDTRPAEPGDDGG